MAAQPDFRDAISADSLIHTTSNRLYFGKLRHYLIVREPADTGLTFKATP